MEENVKFQKLIIDQRKKYQANIIKKEGKELKKLRNKNDRAFLKKVQDRRFEFHVLAEASRIKILQSQHEKYVSNVANKEEGMAKETKVISKKIKEAKKLEKMEIQVLERLKQTYAKQ